jgi:hypothetical protein
MRVTFDEFSRQVEEAGLVANDCGNGHWQIKGGALLVNYYPQTSKMYVAGTTGGKVCRTVAEAIAATQIPPSRVAADLRDGRHRSTRPARAALLRKDDRCHWCGKKLTLDTSTLDHLVPLARGGLDNANNWTLACEPCNRGRGSDMPELARKPFSPFSSTPIELDESAR